MDNKTDTPQIVTEIQEEVQNSAIKSEDLKESTSDSLIDILKLLKGKSYAPKTTEELMLLDNMDPKLVKQMTDLANKLNDRYGIKPFNFDVFKDDLLLILLSRNSEKKLELLKGKSYAPRTVDEVKRLGDMDINEIKSRIEMASEVEAHGKRVNRLFFFCPPRNIQKKLRREKLKLLKGTPCAPSYYGKSGKILLDKMDTNEVNRRVELATKLEQIYNVKIIGFWDFERGLSEIIWTEDLKNKLELLKGKSYAPKTLGEVVSLSKMDTNEVNRRIELATKLEQKYDIKMDAFSDFENGLFIITWTEELRNKLELLKWKLYAPKTLGEVVTLNKMDINEINKRVELATKLEQKYDIKMETFSDFKNRVLNAKLERMSLL